MSTDITIRRERADHPQVVAQLTLLDSYLASLYPPDANHIMDVQSLLAPEVSFFAAWAGDQVVGTAAVRRMPGSAATGGQAYGEVKRMYVDPARRGQRLGVRLIERLEAELIERGVLLALLETGRDQQGAVRLYQRCGYVQRGAFDDYPDNGLSVFYAKVLSP
jgi:putative acetyltransferase